MPLPGAREAERRGETFSFIYILLFYVLSMNLIWLSASNRLGPQGRGIVMPLSKSGIVTCRYDGIPIGSGWNPMRAA